MGVAHRTLDLFTWGRTLHPGIVDIMGVIHNASGTFKSDNPGADGEAREYKAGDNRGAPDESPGAHNSKSREDRGAGKAHSLYLSSYGSRYHSHYYSCHQLFGDRYWSSGPFSGDEDPLRTFPLDAVVFFCKDHAIDEAIELRLTILPAQLFAVLIDVMTRSHAGIRVDVFGVKEAGLVRVFDVNEALAWIFNLHTQETQAPLSLCCSASKTAYLSAYSNIYSKARHFLDTQTGTGVQHPLHH
jgi:hypothetical protein